MTLAVHDGKFAGLKRNNPRDAPRRRDLLQFARRKRSFFSPTELAGGWKSSQQYISIAIIKAQRANHFSKHLPTSDSLSSPVRCQRETQ